MVEYTRTVHLLHILDLVLDMHMLFAGPTGPVHANE